jgi:hypothetical protein
MKTWEKLVATGIIVLLFPVAVIGFLLIACSAIVKTLFDSGEKDEDFYI